MKRFIILSLFILLQGCTTFYSNVKPLEQDTWVVISYLRGTKTGEYIVKLDKTSYNKLLSSQLKGWLELKNVYWNKKGRIRPQAIAGKKWNYSNTAILRVENINRVIPLSAAGIKKIEANQ